MKDRKIRIQRTIKVRDDHIHRIPHLIALINMNTYTSDTASSKRIDHNKEEKEVSEPSLIEGRILYDESINQYKQEKIAEIKRKIDVNVEEAVDATSL